MQAQKLSPLQGWGWIRAGWQVFRLQPINFCAVAATYLLLALFTEWGVITLLGSACSALSHGACGVLEQGVQFALLVPLPLLTVGLWQAPREALAGRIVFPVILFWAFSQGRETLGRLLLLGAIEGALIVAVQLPLPAEPEPAHAPAAQASTPTPPSARSPSTPTDVPGTSSAIKPDAQPAEGSNPSARAEAEAFPVGTGLMLLRSAVCVPILMLLWFSPALTAWDRLPVGKSLFFSAAAAWRNRWPFLTFGVSLFALFLGAMMLFVTLASLGIGSFVIVFMVPALVTLVAVYECACYASYRTVLTASGS